MAGRSWGSPSHEDIALGCRLVITLVILIGSGIELDLNQLNNETAAGLIGILGVIVGYWFTRSNG